jgi:V8-like Glu-specific endopeptidase
MTTSAINLPLNERNRLIEVISGLYDFIEGPRNRRIFLQGTAGLGRFVPGMDLSGDSRTIVTDLMSRLEQFGELPERPAYHALGALLSAVLGLGELQRDNATFLAQLIVRYSLVADPAYINKLRSDYAIADRAVRQPPSQVDIPALPVKTPPRGPAFVTDIRDEGALEQVIDSEDNFLDINLLIGAVYCSFAVCRVEVPKGQALGTGFLVNTDWLLTNQHVLKNQGYLQDAVARFGYMLDASGEVTDPGNTFVVNPDFYFSSPAEELDYALVRLQAAPLQGMIANGDELNLPMKELFKKGKHRGYLVLAGRNIRENDRLSIIQHPGGDFMKVVLTQNYVVKDMSANRVQYVADTKEGSSGSPVFNKNWEVVALHHSGKPYPPDSVIDTAKKAWKGHFRSNEGIPMRAILDDFKQKGLLRYLPQI